MAPKYSVIEECQCTTGLFIPTPGGPTLCLPQYPECFRGKAILTIFNLFPHIDAFWLLCSRWIFENIVTKEEIDQNKQFLLLPQCFPLLVIENLYNWIDNLFFDKICSKSSAAELYLVTLFLILSQTRAECFIRTIHFFTIYSVDILKWTFLWNFLYAHAYCA